jgi:hypothetical protein
MILILVFFSHKLFLVSANSTLGLSMSIGGLEISRSLPLDLWLNNTPALIERMEKNEGLSSQDWIILALSPLGILYEIDRVCV